MTPASLRWLALWACLLAAVICLLFLPVSLGPGVSLLTVLVVLSVLFLRWISRRATPSAGDLLQGLPEARYRLPVVFMCGDLGEDQSIRVLPQGCLIPVNDISSLMHSVHQLLFVRPEWGPQIAICYGVSPQRVQDLTATEQAVFALRWQIAELRRVTRLPVPLLLSTGVATGNSDATHPLWQMVLPGDVRQIWQDTSAPVSPHAWLRKEGQQAIQHQALLNVLEAWVLQNVVQVLSEQHPDTAPVRPLAVVLSLLPGRAGATSLWDAWLSQRTTLSLPSFTPTLHLSPPGCLLALLPAGQGVTSVTRMAWSALMMLLAALAIALCSVAWNNQTFIRQVAFDLQRYERIPMTDYAPKVVAVAALRANAVMLDDYARQGAPLRLGLGLYQGGSLHLPVLRAIALWQPASHNVPHSETPPELVRLDSLSLFDSGKAVLKAGSDNVLNGALPNIKAKPGWLIVVSGHTDGTGSPEANQRLSLKRAEAVRNWLRDSGGMPERCFAVQGYGPHRPIANNQTPQGRAANRRVEISLVPQVDACQVADTTPPSSRNGDGIHL